MDTQHIEVAKVAIRMYAETHPRPVAVTQTQAADMLGVSRSTMTRLVRSGQFALNKCGLIPIGQIDEAISGR
jgi:predicted DNA-binding protein (UPF0251 family)